MSRPGVATPGECWQGRGLDVCCINPLPVPQSFPWERHAPAWLLEPGWSPAIPGSALAKDLRNGHLAACRRETSTPCVGLVFPLQQAIVPRSRSILEHKGGRLATNRVLSDRLLARRGDRPVALPLTGSVFMKRTSRSRDTIPCRCRKPPYFQCTRGRRKRDCRDETVSDGQKGLAPDHRGRR